VKAIRLCTRICTELLKDDSDGERLAERVDDIMNDNPRSKVRWIQTAVIGGRGGAPDGHHNVGEGNQWD
jgi:hypothetical protein